MKNKFDNFIKQWLYAWNNHDLEEIMSHYADDIVLTSPIAGQLIPDSKGIIVNKLALHDYFKIGLEKYPDLHFELKYILQGIRGFTIVYKSVNEKITAEVMVLNDNDQVTRVDAYYSST